MPRKKDESTDSSIVRIRLSNDLIKDCEEARLAGMRDGDAQSTFLGYLVKLGLAKYNKIILPAEKSENGVAASVSEKLTAEKSDEQPPQKEGRIIYFPGCEPEE
jgi:hypothetical protein